MNSLEVTGGLLNEDLEVKKRVQKCPLFSIAFSLTNWLITQSLRAKPLIMAPSRCSDISTIASGYEYCFIFDTQRH